MVFSRHLLEGIRRGRIRCSIRVWTRQHVKPGGRYPLQGEGHVVVDSIEQIALADITQNLARESGFDSVEALLAMARHGRGDNVYLIRFHYLRSGAWEEPPPSASPSPRTSRSLLQRIQSSRPPSAATESGGAKPPRQARKRRR